MHYYPHHIGDYLSHTSNLTLLEHGVYLRLLQCYYMQECPLTGDINRQIAARSDDEKEAVSYVLKTFFTQTDDGYIQAGADKRIAAFREKSDKARKAVESRWHSGRITNESGKHTDVLKTDTDAIPTNNQEPVTNNQEPVKTLAVSDKSLPAVQVKKIGFDYAEKRWVGLQENASQIKIWAETYPGVDLRAEFMEMKSWLTSNPANRKTNLSRFINNWLKKSQDRASRPENKTFAERTQDFKDKQAVEFYREIGNADQQTLKKWGLA